jgi:hypothetical protein
MNLKRDSRSVVVESRRGHITKLFCTCGYHSAAKMERKENNTMSYLCEKCEKEAEINLIDNVKKKLAFVTKNENAEKIDYTLTIYMYRDSNREVWSYQPIEKIDFKFSKRIYKIEVDKITGEAFITRGKEKVTLKSTRYRELQTKFLQDLRENKEICREMFGTFLKVRGVEYVDYEKLINEERLEKALLFREFPNLQLLDTTEITRPSNKKHIEIINNSKSKIEMIQNLIGHKSKNIRKLIENKDFFNFLLVWGKEIKEPENVINFTKNIYFNNYDVELFDSNYADQDFYTGLHLIKDLHKNKDEKIWINRIVKALNQGSYGISEYQLYSYIGDIGRMFTYIKREKQDYKVKFDGDINKLHDILSMDQRKLRVPNRVIPYKENELKWEKEIDEKRKFILAPNTHFLVEVGALMGICVGSYHDYAYQKTCTIVVLKEDEHPVVCIEVRGNELIQAKTKRNSRPTGNYLEEVIKWCEENEINYKDCYDIA